MKKHIPTALAVIAALAITVIALGAANAQEATAQTLVPAELTQTLGDAARAEITAYKQAQTDGINWQVDVANVDLGNGCSVTYFVTLNALTGEVIMVDMTR